MWIALGTLLLSLTLLPACDGGVAPEPRKLSTREQAIESISQELLSQHWLNLRGKYGWCPEGLDSWDDADLSPELLDDQMMQRYRALCDALNRAEDGIDVVLAEHDARDNWELYAFRFYDRHPNDSVDDAWSPVRLGPFTSEQDCVAAEAIVKATRVGTQACSAWQMGAQIESPKEQADP